MIKNLRDFIKILKSNKDIIEINEEVDSYLEVAELHRRVIDKQGPALLFNNVKGAKFPLATNLFGTPDRVQWAFGNQPKEFIQLAAHAAKDLMPPTPKKLWGYKGFLLNALKIGSKFTSKAPVLEVRSEPDLTTLPIITSWKTDGGPFVTLPLVYTESPENAIHNLGMYRIQIFDKKTTGIHWQIHKGCGFHYAEAEQKNLNLPLNLYIGGPPALILSAIAPLPENVPELVLASMLLGGKLNKTKDPNGGYDLISEAEFAFTGFVKPKERRPEGPFGDHYGYNSLQHDYPVFNVQHMYHRKDAIYPATVVGKPKQEDFYIGDYLQDLLSPLFPIVMPSVIDLWSYGDTGFHSLAAAKVKVRYPKEAFGTGLRILGEGQLSLTKILHLTDGDVNLKNFKESFTYLIERCNFATDLHIFSSISQDTLDYTGPKVNEGSKMIMIGVGEQIRELPSTLEKNKSPYFAEPFCPGVLVVEGADYQTQKNLPQEILNSEYFDNWPMIYLVDKDQKIGQNEAKFLWTTYTRFEPAADVHAKNLEYKRYHPIMQAPILIDCRKKPWHTDELIVDDQTKNLVDKKWADFINKI